MEKLLAKTCGANLLILRLSKVFDMIKGSGTLLDEIAGLLMRGELVLAAKDQFFCPTFVDDTVNVISRLLTTDASGLMHLCAPTKMSRLELAQSITRAFDFDKKLVKSISLRDLRESFMRPLDTSMVCDRLGGYMKYDFKGIQECIEALKMNYLRNIHE